MSMLAAAVVLAWICLVLLTFAMAGLLHQMRDLQIRLVELGAQGPRPLVGRRFDRLAGAGPGAILLLDPGCGLCGPVFTAFVSAAGQRGAPRMAAVSFRTSPDWPDQTDVAVHIDNDLYRELDIPWSPALLLVDADGTITATRPVDSPHDLNAQLAEFSGPTGSAGQSRTPAPA